MNRGKCMSVVCISYLHILMSSVMVLSTCQLYGATWKELVSWGLLLLLTHSSGHLLYIAEDKMKAFDQWKCSRLPRNSRK